LHQTIPKNKTPPTMAIDPNICGFTTLSNLQKQSQPLTTNFSPVNQYNFPQQTPSKQQNNKALSTHSHHMHCKM
jgi:hypothetical protein